MSGAGTRATQGERRTGLDRRRRRHLLAWRWVMGGRRRRGRRAGDASGCPLDWYPPSLLAAAVAILALSAFDAAFTLHLLEHGLAVEANPIMAALIESNVRTFVNLKTALTGTCIVLLVIYSETQLLGALSVGRCLHVLAALYAVLIGYEIVLIG